MILYEYNKPTYSDFINGMAEVLGAPLNDNLLEVPPAFGQGWFRLVNLEEGMEALLYDFSLEDDLLLRRLKNENEYYIVILDELQDPEKYSLAIGEEKTTGQKDWKYIFYMTSFLYDKENMVQKGTHTRGCRVYLSPEWVNTYLKLGDTEDTLKKYIHLKTAGIWSKAIDLELRDTLLEMLSPGEKNLLYYKSRSLRIVESFFEWLQNESQQLPQTRGITRQDIKSAENIEALLTRDVTVIPPTIPELARQAAMSESKLKKIFKSVYGMPPYEYFQKKRMQKARTLLLSGNYSIKDVGYTLGYSNLSNFTLAFKKEFSVLPSQVLKSIR